MSWSPPDASSVPGAPASRRLAQRRPRFAEAGGTPALPVRLGLLLGVWLLALTAPRLAAALYYVAPGGSDASPGTLMRPFATIQRAQQAAAPGDTVYLRGGTYILAEEQIATRTGIWAYVTHLDKSGAPAARIRYWAYPGERPVFDCSRIKPAGLRVIAFFVSGSWLHLRGLEITGVQVTILTHTQSECVENQGSHNLYEQLSMHDGMAIGLYLNRGADNLILNCDAYRNWDGVSEGGRGGNVDGFGGHPAKGGVGNVFRGCRAWFNSDDGFDCINASERIVWENCQAFFNGYTPDFKSRADGNGFKSGGYGAAGGRVPSPVPRHATRFCLAVGNKANGFYANHHLGGCDWIGNTAFQNGANYNLLSVLADNDTDVPGYGHYLRNNLGFSPRGSSVANLDRARSDVLSNFFTLPVKVDAGDFAAAPTDSAQLEAFVARPRQADGSLPDLPLLHLATGSDLVDAGVDVGYPFSGAAPDLGAFESGTPGSAGRRVLTWKGDGAARAWDNNVSANWRYGSIPAKFAPTDVLVFDDTGSAGEAIELVDELWPASVEVRGAKDYTFAGSGTLAGPMSLMKAGTGTLTLNGRYRYEGATTVRAGTLHLAGSLSTTGRVEVLPGATLDLTGTLTALSVTLRPGGRLIGGGRIQGQLIDENAAPGDSAPGR